MAGLKTPRTVNKWGLTKDGGRDMRGKTARGLRTIACRSVPQAPAVRTSERLPGRKVAGQVNVGEYLWRDVDRASAEKSSSLGKAGRDVSRGNQG